jgi:protein-S-isoprenylcysteine O-methyltransferase Ste14
MTLYYCAISMPASGRPRLSLALAAAAGGAALFAVALGVFLYAYTVRFGTAAGGGLRAVAADLALFTGFALHHSVFARAPVKGLVARVVPPELERSLYTWGASALFLVVTLSWQPVDGVAWRLPGVWRMAGFAAQVAGVVLTMQGSARLDALELAGVRQVLQARRDDPPRPPVLETTGPYALVRHPVYFAWALFVFGAPDMTATRLAFALISTAYLAAAIPLEERSLTRTFGPEYARYQRKVRWRMLPGLY